MTATGFNGMQCDAADCGPPDPAGQDGTRKGARLERDQV
jgi:hypothetical protein